jgi:hypothetical protein
MFVAGGVWALVWRLMRSGETGRRIERLREERELVAQQYLLTPDEFRRRRIDILERQKPSRVPPLVLLGFGGTAATVGLTGMLALHRDAALAIIFASVFVGGSGLAGFGFWQLYARNRERLGIDREISALPVPPPIESKLPAAPVYLGYAWAF